MKPCPSFPGYFATEDGRIISRRRRRSNLELRQHSSPKGYRYVGALDGGRMRPVQVHLLVADAFLGPRPSRGHQVRHLDGNPANNAPGNLAWGTVHDNAQDRQRHGRYARGGGHHNAKLTDEMALKAAHLFWEGRKIASLAREMSVSPSTISDLLHGRSFKHLSFKRIESAERAA
jgi:hypothetical protein